MLEVISPSPLMGEGWVGGEIAGLCFNLSPFTPGEGELLRPTFCKVSVWHDTNGLIGRGTPTFSDIAIAKSFFRQGKPSNPPCPPLRKGGNYKKLRGKSPLKKGDLGAMLFI